MRYLRLFLRIVAPMALVAGIALLVAGRPALPTAVGFSSARRIDLTLVFIAWLGCLLLAVGLLYRLTSSRRSPPQPRESTIRHLHPIPRAKPFAAAAYLDSAFPLILKRAPAPADRPAERSRESARTSLDSGDEVSRRSETGPSISLLGPLTIRSGQKHLRGLRGPTKELLVYLALHPAGAHRDQIIDALWLDQAPDKGRNRLWRAASDARSHFGEAIISRDGDHYHLERTEITIDLDRLDQLTSELEFADHQEGRLAVLERALALFLGEPLAGSDFPWAENEQRRLHALHLDLLERAGLARLELGDPSGALADAETGLALEPYNEQLARVAMQAEASLGLRSAILNRYERLSELLDAQLGLQPHRETKALYRTLLGQDVSGSGTPRH